VSVKKKTGRTAIARWILVTSIVFVSAAAALLIGQARESSKAGQMAAALAASATRPAAATVDFASLSELPPPVTRYFRHVLSDGQGMIRSAEILQAGELRTGAASERWLPFTARQIVAPPATGFLWNARVEFPWAGHVRVLDSYIAGVGSGRVSLLSALAVASETGTPELDSGALHRYPRSRGQAFTL
jgi:hypothetical protein